MSASSFTKEGLPNSPACSLDYGFDAAYYELLGKAPLAEDVRQLLSQVYATWIQKRGIGNLHATLLQGQIKKTLAELSPDGPWEALALPCET